MNLHSEETKRRISIALKGKTRKKFTKEHRENLSRALKNKWDLEEYKQIMSLAHRGKKLSEDTKNKISRSNKGKHSGIRSEGWCKRISDGLMGKNKGPKTEEHRRRISLALTGRLLSKQTRKKMSDSSRGKPKKPFSVEHRIKMSINATKQIQNGFSPNRTFKRGIVNNIWLKSSWEIAFALYLNSQNVVWEYEKKSFLLSNGKRYIPDFFVGNQIFEIKGYWNPKSKHKFDLFRLEYPHLSIMVVDYPKMKLLLTKFSDRIDEVIRQT